MRDEAMKLAREVLQCGDMMPADQPCVTTVAQVAAGLIQAHDAAIVAAGEECLRPIVLMRIGETHERFVQRQREACREQVRKLAVDPEVPVFCSKCGRAMGQSTHPDLCASCADQAGA